MKIHLLHAFCFDKVHHIHKNCTNSVSVAYKISHDRNHQKRHDDFRKCYFQAIQLCERIYHDEKNSLVLCKWASEDHEDAWKLIEMDIQNVPRASSN